MDTGRAPGHRPARPAVSSRSPVTIACMPSRAPSLRTATQHGRDRRRRWLIQNSGQAILSNTRFTRSATDPASARSLVKLASKPRVPRPRRQRRPADHRRGTRCRWPADGPPRPGSESNRRARRAEHCQARKSGLLHRMHADRKNDPYPNGCRPTARVIFECIVTSFKGDTGNDAGHMAFRCS